MGEYDQLQILCHQEVGSVAVERFELAAHKARLDSVAADVATQRGFYTQIVADAIEKHRRFQFEPELVHARSQANMWHHACNDIKLQLKDALNKLKLSDGKSKGIETKMQKFHEDAQQAIDAVFAEALDRRKT